MARKFSFTAARRQALQLAQKASARARRGKAKVSSRVGQAVAGTRARIATTRAGVTSAASRVRNARSAARQAGERMSARDTVGAARRGFNLGRTSTQNRMSRQGTRRGGK